jgi:fumarate reductase subunit C
MIKKNNDLDNSNSPSERLDSPKEQSSILSILNKLVPFSMIWVSLVLMFGVICMYTNAMGQDEFYRFIFFLRSPFIIVLNSIALLVAIFHSICWFNSIPKTLFLYRTAKKSQVYLIIIGLWIATIFVSAYLLLFILR